MNVLGQSNLESVLQQLVFEIRKLNYETNWELNRQHNRLHNDCYEDHGDNVTINESKVAKLRKFELYYNLNQMEIDN